MLCGKISKTGLTHVVENGKGSNDGVDKVDTRKLAVLVVSGEERHESTTHDTTAH